MKYLLLLILLLLTECKMRDEFLDQECLEESVRLSRNVREMNNLAFSHKDIKFKLLIDVEFGAYHLERCIKKYTGKTLE